MRLGSGTGIAPNVRDLFNPLTINAGNYGVRRLAQSCSIFRNRIQHRLNIRRRAGDDAQDLTRRRLLLQRSP